MSGQDQPSYGFRSIIKKNLYRLLKVNPEERLTVEQVLEHPWLSQAPNTELQSPAVMMDKVREQSIGEYPLVVWLPSQPLQHWIIIFKTMETVNFFFLIWNHHKYLSQLFPIHLNTYVTVIYSHHKYFYSYNTGIDFMSESVDYPLCHGIIIIIISLFTFEG